MVSTNLHLIRAFEGPRHARLEKIWERVGALCPNLRIHVHDNLATGGGPPPLQHGQKLQEIWEEAKAAPEPFTILTEFDFLPDVRSLQGLAGPHEDGLRDRPIWAAEYATRDPYSRRLRRWGLPGAWFVRVAKLLVPRNVQLDFTAGGPANDPAAKLPPNLTHLLGAEEGRLTPFGVVVPGVGEHLFFSRHYSDPPTKIVAGFVMGEIQRAVDAACDKYEEYLSGLKG